MTRKGKKMSETTTEPEAPDTEAAPDEDTPDVPDTEPDTGPDTEPEAAPEGNESAVAGRVNPDADTGDDSGS